MIALHTTKSDEFKNTHALKVANNLAMRKNNE